LFSAGAAAADGPVAIFANASLGRASVGGFAIVASSATFRFVLDSFAAAPKRLSAPDSIVGLNDWLRVKLCRLGRADRSLRGCRQCARRD
jgi:hypothetical protein